MIITDKFVLFWQPTAVFSNFYLSQFEHDDFIYMCSEQAFMAEKAKFFEDYDIYKQLLELDPSSSGFATTCKKLGRAVKNYDDAIWSLVRGPKMFSVLLSKFSTSLRTDLLDTEDLIIVEASPYDKIWGIGFSKETALNNPIPSWGENLLGKELMNVRYALRHKNSN